MAKNKKKSSTKAKTPNRNTTTLTRSQVEQDLENMFLELDENGRVREGSTFVPAHDRPSKTTKTVPKPNLIKDQTPQSILKNTAMSHSSRSGGQSVTFAKDATVAVPGVVEVDSPSLKQVDNFARGTQSSTSVPDGTQGNNVPTKTPVSLPTSGHSSKSATGTKSDGANPSTMSVDFAAMTKEQLLTHLTRLQSELDKSNKSNGDDVSHVASPFPDPTGNDPSEDLVPNSKNDVTIKTITTDRKNLVTNPDDVAAILTSPPKNSKSSKDPGTPKNTDGHRHSTPAVVADDSSAEDSAISQTIRRQVEMYEERLREALYDAKIDSEDPVPYVDYTLQSEYSPTVIDTVVQSNKIRSVLGNAVQTKEATMDVILDAVTATSKKKPLLRPSHFNSDVHSGVDQTPLDDVAMYSMLRTAGDDREADINRLRREVADAQTEADRLEAQRQADLHRQQNPTLYDRVKRTFTPRRPKVSEVPVRPDPTPSNSLKRVVDNQPDEVWNTLRDVNYHPVTLTKKAVSDFALLKKDFVSEYIEYYDDLPDNEFVSMMRELGQQIINEDVRAFVVPAYTNGAGMNLTFHNLDSYRSIHAEAVKEWLKHAVNKFYPELEIKFFANPLDKIAITFTKLCWFIKEMPLATKHYLVELNKMRERHADSPSFKEDPRVQAFNMAVDAVSKAWTSTVMKNVSTRPSGMHPFDVGTKKTRQGHVARNGRVFLRTEPLQFPQMQPPHGRTHAHGRYVRNISQAAPTWVDYQNQGPDEMLLLPPNVSKDPSHWEFRRLPDGTIIRSMNDLIGLVINYKARNGIPFNPIDPLGPAIIQGIYRTFDGDQIKATWDKAATIDDDFTPVEYAPRRIHYRDLTPEEAEAFKASTMDPVTVDEDSELTSSPDSDKDKTPTAKDSKATDVVDAVPSTNEPKSLDPDLGGDDTDLKAYTAFMNLDGGDGLSSQKPSKLFPNATSTPKSDVENLLSMDEPMGMKPTPSSSSKKPPDQSKSSGLPKFDSHQWSTTSGGMSFKPGEWSNPAGSPPNPPDIQSTAKGHGGGPPGNAPPGNSGTGNSGAGGGKPDPHIFHMKAHTSGNPDPNAGSGGHGGGDGGSQDGGSSSSSSSVMSKKVFAMKPEIKYFKNLESWDNFPDWFDDFVATCGGTGLYKHTDFTYKPTQDEWNYYSGLDRWLYVILKHRIQVTEGRDILRQEKSSLSGRKVLFQLWKYSLRSAVADLTSEQRLVDITNMSLDSSWNKSALSFINKFTKEVETYNSTCKNAREMISQEMSMILLQRAVIQVKPLADVKARERHSIAEGRPKYTYQQYMELLKDEAGRVDRLRAKARSQRERVGRRVNNTRRPTRRVNRSERDDDDDPSNDDDDNASGSSAVVNEESYDGMLEIFKVIIGGQGQRMDSASFDKLSPSGKKLWRQMTMDDRSTMLNSKPENQRSANRTEMADSEEGSADSEDGDDQEGSSDDKKKTSINKTETRSSAKSKSHPADIRRSMSKSASKKSGTQSRTISNVGWSISEETEDDILQELGELEDDEIPPNDDSFDDSDDSSRDEGWPAFEGSVGDYWDDSSDDEDFA